jgi:hypothetical protein
MTRRWKEVEPILTTLLKDEVPVDSERVRRYAPADLRSWWNNGQVRLSTMKPLHRHLVYTKEDYKTGMDEVQVILPDGFYRPRMVMLADKQQLKRLSIEEKFYNPEAVGYCIYEGRLLLFGGQPDRFMLAYDAFYPAIKNVDSKVESPLWADEPLAIYAAMQALTREMVADARYRKFLGKQDSGNPQQTPFLPVAKWMEERFNAIVSMHADDDEDARK